MPATDKLLLETAKKIVGIVCGHHHGQLWEHQAQIHIGVVRRATALASERVVAAITPPAEPDRKATIIVGKTAVSA